MQTKPATSPSAAAWRLETTAGQIEPSFEEYRMSGESRKSKKRRHRRSSRKEREVRPGWEGEDDFLSEGEVGISASRAEALEELDDSLLTTDERAYRDARRLADRKVRLYRELFRAGLITIPLLLIFFPAGMIALFYFSVKLGRHSFREFYEPQLRERFTREEVQRRVRTQVSSERQHLEGEHHRSLEQLSASIAHEIRNPITAAKSLVQQMGEDVGGEDQEEYARVAVAELERVERSISHLLRFAREEETRVTRVAMEDVVESAVETFRDRASRSGIEIVRSFDGPGELEGDPEQLRRVVINLVSNAIDALEESAVEGPEIRISLGENLAGSEIWLRIADNGRGIEADAQGQIFDPFFTSRANGTGLGLALCRKIVDNHQGRIDVESTAGEGTEFLLSFPRTAARAGRPDEGANP